MALFNSKWGMVSIVRCSNNLTGQFREHTLMNAGINPLSQFRSHGFNTLAIGQQNTKDSCCNVAVPTYPRTPMLSLQVRHHKSWQSNDRYQKGSKSQHQHLEFLDMDPRKIINIHAANIEHEALGQFKHCVGQDFVLEAALMPDAHTGYVAPIGAVIKTRGAVVPSWVGYDIGCGMIAVKISDAPENQDLIRMKGKELFDRINYDIPMGVGEHNKPNIPIYFLKQLEMHFDQLNVRTKLRDLVNVVNYKSEKNLGTLGSGNHFIEVCVDKNETWLVIHSGSRAVGHYIGTYFMKAVSGRERGFEATFSIQDEIMKREYMYYQKYCLEFALLNRLSMARKMEKAIFDITGIKYDTYEKLWTNKNHNHCIEVEHNVFLHRKGATSSDKGEYGVIPGNMKDGCYLVEGLGNSDFLCSSSHGAGRQLSRTKAKATITLDQFKKTMSGIIAPVQTQTIDESPFAYKDIVEVMELQKESVRILQHLKPIINWKGFK